MVVAHDWLCGLRGGEQVLSDIISTLQRRGCRVSCLLTMFSDGRPLTEAIDALPRWCAWPGRLPLASTWLRRHLLPLYPAAVADLSRHLAALHGRTPVDLVVSTSSAAVKGLVMPEGSGGRVAHISYIHAPARYLWSQTDQYSRAGLVQRVGLAACGPALRAWDRRSAQRPDMLLANSIHTQGLIRAAFGRSSRVLYPGVRTELFTPAPIITESVTPGSVTSWPAGDRGRAPLLVVSALEPYKRVDLAITAAGLLGRRLVVVGGGSLRAVLGEMAGPMVTFAGRVSDEKLLHYYRSSAYLLHPQVEDFGITSLEAQAAGLPVVALGAGGAKETVVEGVTGSHFAQQSVESLLAGIDACEAYVERGEVTAANCVTHAAKFSRGAFADGLEVCLLELLACRNGREARAGEAMVR